MALLAVPVAAQQHYTVPRTPWGDPDIQGNYTNLTEAGTPLEKPKELEGRNLSDIPGEELRAIKRQAAERTIGAFLGPNMRPTTGGKTPIGRSSTARRHGSSSTRRTAGFRR